METFAEKVLQFYKTLRISSPLPGNVEAMLPFEDSAAWNLIVQFYTKFFNDTNERYCILGINPGRFGGGVTGIPFTDPDKLVTFCEIPNNLPKKEELSARYIYKVIANLGGPGNFYQHYFISAVSPIGYIKNNKNYNYYDDKQLLTFLEPYIIKWLHEHRAMGCIQSRAFCLGTGKNYACLTNLNSRFHFFKEIIPLEHPRFIMQYRTKHIDDYIKKYVEILKV
ncbi:MAG: DUF4918 family protein [Ignavibacteria bacterium]|nr:DUF4918 family protein [Ignavibacteria bacterium]